MVDACAKTGAVDHSVSALAVATWPGQVPLGGGQQKRNKNKGKKKQGTPKPTGMGATFLCARCLSAGHYAHQCKAKFHANGQPLAGLGNGKKSTQGNCALTQVIPQSTAPAQVCPASSEASPMALLAWMYVPLVQPS